MCTPVLSVAQMLGLKRSAVNALNPGNAPSRSVLVVASIRWLRAISSVQAIGSHPFINIRQKGKQPVDITVVP
jgi:hypothetical protein